MSFDSAQHPRATNGQFAEKAGAAAEISLSESPRAVDGLRPQAPEVALADKQFPADFPADSSVAEQIAWALRTDAEVTLHDNGQWVTTSNGLELANAWHEMRLGARPEIVEVRMPGTALDAISVKDTTAADRFLGASDAAWSRYRDEQESLRKMIPEVLAERTHQDFPDATGLVFETEILDDGRTILGYTLVSVEGPNRVEMRSAPFVSGDFKKLQRIENELSEYCSQAAEMESDWHDAATARSNSGPNTQWEVKF